MYVSSLTIIIIKKIFCLNQSCLICIGPVSVEKKTLSKIIR